MSKEYVYYVYIIASVTGTLYVGVTNNLQRRVFEHKQDSIEGFTKIYSCHKLVYYEQYSDIRDAISREKQLKKWRRDKKEKLIRTGNSSWKDLSLDL
ncbi:MAG: GIY-YIG nuclease family protein [Candidatus Paceibacterota bacterium]|jgi:putative endonuclease